MPITPVCWAGWCGFKFLYRTEQHPGSCRAELCPDGAAVGRPPFFRHPVVCGGIAVSIALVGIAYNILLRHLWHPQGWQWVADELLHDIMPLAFVLYWWLYVPKGALRLRHVPLWAIYPVIYFAYVLLRGHMLGDYLYPFIDVGTIGFPKAFINALGVLLGFLLVALLLLGVDRWAARRTM